MREFAFFRFKSTNMLTSEEEKHKQEIVELTEEVLDAKGIECDSKISRISEEQLREILEVRKLRKRRKRVSSNTENEAAEEEEGGEGVEQVKRENLEVPKYVR